MSAVLLTSPEEFERAARVSMARSTDLDHGPRCGLLFEPLDQDRLVAVATDAFTMAWTVIQQRKHGLDRAVVVPGGLMDRIIKTAKLGSSGAPASLFIEGDSAVHRHPGMSVSMRLLPGIFPSWRNVLPSMPLKGAMLMTNPAGSPERITRKMGEALGYSGKLRWTCEGQDSLAGRIFEIAGLSRYIGEANGVTVIMQDINRPSSDDGLWARATDSLQAIGLGSAPAMQKGA